jgi:hypothetical protein
MMLLPVVMEAASISASPRRAFEPAYITIYTSLAVVIC